MDLLLVKGSMTILYTTRWIKIFCILHCSGVWGVIERLVDAVEQCITALYSVAFSLVFTLTCSKIPTMLKEILT